MRILLVTNMYPSRERPDYGVFVARLADALRARGHDVEDVVLHAMAKDPEWRFADADEFIAALEAVRGRPATGSFAHVPELWYAQ